MSLKIKKGDKVVVLAGKDKGKSGKVMKITAEGARAIVEGINIVKRHMRRRSDSEPAGIKEMPAALHISNLALYCGHCQKAVRFGVLIMGDGSRARLCKKCKQVIA